MLTEASYLTIQILKGRNFSQREIERTTGIARGTIRKYWDMPPDAFAALLNRPKKRRRVSILEPHRAFIEAEFFRQSENCEAVRQVLIREKGISISLRMLQRFLKPFREQLAAKRKRPSRTSAVRRRQG